LITLSVQSTVGHVPPGIGHLASIPIVLTLPYTPTLEIIAITGKVQTDVLAQTSGLRTPGLLPVYTVTNCASLIQDSTVCYYTAELTEVDNKEKNTSSSALLNVHPVYRQHTHDSSLYAVFFDQHDTADSKSVYTVHPAVQPNRLDETL